MDDFFQLGFGSDYEDEDANDAAKSLRSSTRDESIFLVDFSSSMLSSSHYSDTLSAIHQTYRSKIITSEKDLLAVIFFGTQSSSSNDYSHVQLIQPLSPPGAESIRVLGNALKYKSSQFNHSNDYNLAEVFLYAQSHFKAPGKTTGTRSITVFTDNDNPHCDAKSRDMLVKRVEDLNQCNIDLSLIALGEKFNAKLFYSDVLGSDNIHNGMERIEDMMNIMKIKEYKRRSMVSVGFKIGNFCEIGVKVYKYVSKAKKPSAVKLDKDTNHEVITRTEIISQNTAQVLMPNEVQFIQKYADEEIEFSKDEIPELKKLAPTGIQLLGFRHSTCFNPRFYLKPGDFLYPDENSVRGSITLFSALLKKCLERDMFALCCITLRTSSSPRLAWLLPQKEEIDIESSQQIKPPGFQIFYLPYADELRNLSDILKDDEERRSASVKELRAAHEIAKKLKFTWNPEDICNPALQKFYAHLEAHALETDVSDLRDFTEINLQKQKKRLGESLDNFIQLVYPEGLNLKGAKPGVSQKTKEVKKEVIKLNGDELENLAKAGKLGKYTLPVLKAACDENFIKYSGRKQDVIAAIEKHYNI